MIRYKVFKMPWLRFSSPSGSLVVLFLAAILLVAVACIQPSKDADELSLMWEGWDHIKSSYVDSESLDLEEVNRSIVSAMLEVVEEPSYPFLTELKEVKRVPSRVPGELSDVWRAWKLLRERWPEVDPKLLSDAALQGMMNSLGDPSAEHLAPEAYSRAQESLTGSYEGIGAYVGTAEDNVVILGVMEASPAERAGLQAGDIVQQVNGESLEGLTLQESVDKVRGPQGSKVSLVVERVEEGTIDLQIVRGAIDIPTVDVQLFPGAIGYILISRFSQNTGDEFLDALETLQKAEALALILDLRSNPGGSIEAARIVSSQFLDGGLFMYEENREGERKDWLVEEGGIAVEKDFPIAVLVNQATASAAEAVAAALQDRERASVVGVRTVGKGSANQFMKLSNGAALYVPVSHWFTPTGRAIQGQGIEPDIPVALSQADVFSGQDTQLRSAYDYLDEQLPPFR